MKNIFDRNFVIFILVIAIIAIFVGFIAGPFGEVDISIGASGITCIISLVVIVFGLLTWKKGRK